MTPKDSWDPFKVLQALQDNMNRLFEESLSKQMGETSISDEGSWKPVIDIYENENEFVINAELPGLSENDVEIKVENNRLIMTGARKFPFDIKDENYIRLERVYGDFRRDFALSSNVNVDGIEATFIDGLLCILLPKLQDVKPKKIDIISD